MKNESSKPQKGGDKGLPAREPIIDRCYTTEADGTVMKCRKVVDDFCSAFVSPAAKWRLGDCPLADDFLKTKNEKKTSEKIRIGQQKQKRKL